MTSTAKMGWEDDGKAAAFAVLLVAPCLILYFPSLSYFFAQDDFFFLNRAAHISSDNLLAVLEPVGPFYRPISTSFYFLAMLRLFGLHPLPFHLASILIFCLNILLMNSIAATLFRNRTAGFATAFFYLTRGLHFETVSWASGIQELLMIFFLLTSLASYLRFTGGKNWYLAPALLSFSLALLSKETAFVFPFLLLLYHFLYQQTVDYKKAVLVLPFFALAGAVLLLRFLILPPLPQEGEYATNVGCFWVANFFRYLAVSSNILFALILALPRYRTHFLGGTLINTFLVLSMLALAFAVFKRAKAGSCEEGKWDSLPGRNMIFGLAFFLVAVLPALQFENRFEPYYASFASIGISIVLTVFIMLFPNKRVRTSLLMVMFLISLLVNARLRSERLSHVGRFSPIAEEAISSVTRVMEEEKNRSTTLYISGSDESLWRALAQGEGIKVYFPEIDTVIFDVISPGYQMNGSEIVFEYGNMVKE